MAQFVLVNVVVAVLMKHLEESNKVRIVKVTTLMGFNTVVVDRNIQNCLFLLQEAKEEAEMDAEIALEMSMEQQRRLSTTSSHSSVEGTYVGPCPHSPGQVGQNTVILLNGCLSTKLRHELPTVARVHLNNHRKSLLSKAVSVSPCRMKSCTALARTSCLRGRCPSPGCTLCLTTATCSGLCGPPAPPTHWRR